MMQEEDGASVGGFGELRAKPIELSIAELAPGFANYPRVEADQLPVAHTNGERQSLVIDRSHMRKHATYRVAIIVVTGMTRVRSAKLPNASRTAS